MCYFDGLFTIWIILLIYEISYILFWVCSFTSLFNKMRQDKKIRTFAWTLFNALVTLGLGYLTDTQYAVLLMPILNEITKYINLTYFNDLGVK